MAFCKNCGTLMENDVCPNCGTTNTPVDAVPVPEAQPIYAAPVEAQPIYAAPVEAQPIYSAPVEPQPVYSAPVEPQPVYSAPQTQTPPPPPPMYSAPQAPYGQPYGYQPPQYPPQPSKEEPISAGGWIWRSLIPCIPVVGWIIYLVMLFIWMGDETKEESFRNWAKAQLIMLAIALGLVLLFFILTFVLTVGVFSTFASTF